MIFLMRLSFVLHQSTEGDYQHKNNQEAGRPNKVSFQQTPETVVEGSRFSHIMDIVGLEEN